ncbi:YbjN domain-containing protein [Tsukamurella sp. 8F]|uniref:YbjN domain-containing protein n=1 Tax=unclassified Tsukamurella TaxID=2633480 RepID=UPI0023B9A02A|nr:MULTISPECIES: YbjN domain-containing protein [unclassified Tsukamurella]MDF0532359.1 YbjN domain-containing protein [Tsukamurella sp. 8J]MDF0589367.1 YbjN domain-containing protein [Tsukamurella sp. 8F]
MSAELADRIEAALAERDLEYTRKQESGKNLAHFVIELPGEKKLKTSTLLTIDAHGVRVEAFVCRHADENLEEVYRYLLRRNRRLYGVAYTIDQAGDIYLTGRFAESTFDADELDRVLGQVLEAADGDFNILLELGFLTSIRREFDWRVSRGEPLHNLKPFAHLLPGFPSEE